MEKVVHVDGEKCWEYVSLLARDDDQLVIQVENYTFLFVEECWQVCVPRKLDPKPIGKLDMEAGTRPLTANKAFDLINDITQGVKIYLVINLYITSYISSFEYIILTDTRPYSKVDMCILCVI